MDKVWAVLSFIALFTVCLSGGPAHCQSSAVPAKWKVNKLAVEVSRGVSSLLQSDIFVIDSPDSTPRRLVEGNSPAWSPQGTQIAYGTREWGEYSQICVINADGSERRQLTKAKDGAGLPDWSPDGEKITYTTGFRSGVERLHSLGATPPSRMMIWVMSKDGENSKSITEGIGARWSPDGTRLAFIRRGKKRGEKGSIWIVNADGTGEKKIRDNDTPAMEVTWYPDGKSIAFASEQGHNSVISRISLDGTGLTIIASDKRFDLFFPIFSPDGLQLLADAFAAGDSRQTPTKTLEMGFGNGKVLLVDLTGQPGKVMAQGVHPSAVWGHQ